MLAGSPNFSLAEVYRASSSVPRSTVENEPVAARVARTLTVLEAVRATLGHRPVVITSLVRSVERNREVGGAAASAHLQGYGVDIVVPGMSHREVWDKLRPAHRALGLDELVLENDHVHLSTDPRLRGKVLDLTTPRMAPADATATNIAQASRGGCAIAVLFLAAPWVACALYFA